MKLFAATVISLSLFASGTTHAQARAAAGSGAAPTSSLQDSQTIKITRSSSQQSSKGPAEYFTGSVRIEPLFSVHDPEIRKGDVVWIPAGTKHWHGATPNTAMTHIAIQERLNGKVVEWMEKVSDEQYHKQ